MNKIVQISFVVQGGAHYLQGWQGVAYSTCFFELYKIAYVLVISFLSTNKPKPIRQYFATPRKFAKQYYCINERSLSLIGR